MCEKDYARESSDSHAIKFKVILKELPSLSREKDT